MTKKEEILNLALKLFSEEGFDNVGVQKISEEAKVKKPTLYHYFGSKEGLLDVILKENFAEFIEELSNLAVYKGDIVLSLDRIVSHYFNFVKENPLFYRIVLNLSFAPEKSLVFKSLTTYTEIQYKVIQKMFEEAEKQHGNMRGRSHMFAFTFIGMINSAVSYYFYTKDETDLSTLNAQKISKQFMHGIFS